MTVPAANRKPKNRTSKRIIEYPFQPLRRSSRRHHQCEGLRVMVSGSPPANNIPLGIPLGHDPVVDSEALAAVFYNAAAVAKLGLPPWEGALSVRRPGGRHAFGKEGVDVLRHGPDGPGTPVLRYQVL